MAYIILAVKYWNLKKKRNIEIYSSHTRKEDKNAFLWLLLIIVLETLATQ